MPQMVVIVEILIAQRQAKHPLTDQRADLVFDQVGIPMILEAAGKPIDQPDHSIRRAQQQAAGVRRDHPAIERRFDTATFNGCKAEQIRDTLCRHRRSSSGLEKSLRHNAFLRGGTPMHLPPLRYPG